MIFYMLNLLLYRLLNGDIHYNGYHNSGFRYYMDIDMDEILEKIQFCKKLQISYYINFYKGMHATAHQSFIKIESTV